MYGSGSFVVFGASGGIGASLVRKLAAGEATVVAAARDRGRLAHQDFPSAVRLATCDVGDAEQIAACLEFAQDEGGGRVQGVALCVGSILLKPAHMTTDAEWGEVLDKNLSSVFRVARAAVKAMKRGGSVVFCSSAAAAVGLPNHDAISAAKAGVEGLMRSAAATYAARGVRFNAVAPGLVRTPLSAAITGNERALQHSEAMHPLGRIGEPEEVAAAIAWLLDPANSWITGQVLRVDGGMAALRTRARA